MFTPEQLAGICLSMLPDSIIYVTTGRERDIPEAARIQRKLSFGIDTWTFISAQGKSVIVTARPGQDKEDTLTFLTSACFRIPARPVKIFEPLQGETAMLACSEALDSYEEGKGFTMNRTMGLYPLASGSWEAFDNTAGECRIENFDSEMKAAIYLMYDFETAEKAASIIL